MFGRVQKKNLQEGLDSTSWVSVAIDVEAYLVKVNLVSIKMSSVATNATKIKVVVSTDQDGDKQLITESESRIFDGISTSTVGNASFRLDSILPATDNDTFYLHFKLNDQTATLEEVFVSYEV